MKHRVPGTFFLRKNQHTPVVSQYIFIVSNFSILTNIVPLKLDQCILVPLEGDQEIFEEDAVCEICFNPFKVNEDMVKMKCKCKSELVHEACATISNCGVCEQQVEKIHLVLLQLPTDAGVSAHNNGKKLKWFSLFKW